MAGLPRTQSLACVSPWVACAAGSAPPRGRWMLLGQVPGGGFLAAPGLKGAKTSLCGTAGDFFKDAVCIDRFSDDALAKKKKINVTVIVPGRAVDW